MASPIQDNAHQNQTDNASAYVSPSDIIPFPKSAPRKTIRGGRKKGSTSILTDTPVRDRIAAATELRKPVEERKQHKLTVKAQQLAAKHLTQPNRSIISVGATSRKRRAELVPIESSDLGDWQEFVDDDSDQSSDDEIVEGDFVITKEDIKKARSPRLLSLHCTLRCHI